MKKAVDKKPTMKQKAVMLDLLENTGKPIGQAMLDAGYSPATAKNPEELTESKGWKILMDEYLPDKDVLQAHKEGLKATKVISALVVGKDADSKTSDFIDVPDHPTRLKAVELAYKVKSKFQPTTLVQNNFGSFAKKELKEFEE